MKSFLKSAAVALSVAVALAGITSAEAAKKSSKRKFTPAMKQASMGKARAMCMAGKARKGKQFIRAEITDDGRLYCWYR